MNYTKLFGWGALIWVVAYIIATAFVAYGIGEGLVMSGVIIVAVALAAYFAGRNVAAPSAGEMLKYSLGWVIIGLVLDGVLTVPFTGWEIFMSWEIWVGYAAILLVPLLSVNKGMA